MFKQKRYPSGKEPVLSKEAKLHISNFLNLETKTNIHYSINS